MLDRERLDSTLRTFPPDEAARVRMYVGEADFFADVIVQDLAQLPAGSRIIEIGSGVGLLAMTVAQSGFHVVAYEPESSGFGQMRQMRDLLLEHWNGPTPQVTWVDNTLHAGAVELPDHVEYAYAINVIEHVPDIPGFLRDVVSVLTPPVDDSDSSVLTTPSLMSLTSRCRHCSASA